MSATRDPLKTNKDWNEAYSQTSTRHGSAIDTTLVEPKIDQHLPILSTSPTSSRSSLDAQPAMADKDPEKAIPSSISTSTPHSPFTSARDWSGPDDPGNAQNWSTLKKSFNVGCISVVALLSTFASSVYEPGASDVQRMFGVNRETSQVPFVIYALGLGLGAPLTSPISETLGRKFVYISTMPLFGLFTLGAGFSNNIWALCWCRLLAGVFGAPSLSVGSATVSDMFKPEARALPMVLYVIMPFLGPSIGPIIGAVATNAEGWRWTQWVILFYTAGAIIPVCFLHETYKKTILQKRAKKYGLKDGPPGVADGKPWTEVTKIFLRSTLTRPLHMYFTEPVVFYFTTYIAYNFAILYSFYTAFPYVYVHYYGYDNVQSSLTFIAVGVGSAIGGMMLLVIDKFYFRHIARKAATNASNNTNEADTEELAPEHRLLPAMLGGAMMVVGLFWFGWTAENSVHWAAPVVAEGVFGAGNMMVFMGSIMYTTDFYGPLYGASAAAANSLLRYIGGTAFPLFSEQMYSRLGAGWASSLLGFLSCLGAAVPFLLFKFGPELRRRSKYARGD